LTKIRKKYGYTFINMDTSDLGVTLKIWKHVNFLDLSFIILFIGILPFYVINLGVVSLFADLPFTLLAMFVSDIIYLFE